MACSSFHHLLCVQYCDNTVLVDLDHAYERTDDGRKSTGVLKKNTWGVLHHLDGGGGNSNGVVMLQNQSKPGKIFQIEQTFYYSVWMLFLGFRAGHSLDRQKQAGMIKRGEHKRSLSLC